MKDTFIPPISKDAQLSAFQEIIKSMPEGQLPSIEVAGKKCEVPSALAEVFQKLLSEVVAGNPVTVIAHEKKMTTQDAADYLGMSRPTLIKFLEKYDVPVETIGRHRRIAFNDVVELQQRIRHDRREVLTELIRVTEELGLYEEELRRLGLTPVNEAN